MATTIAYTSETVKGCIMLWDDTFGVDMDEMQYAYYAGLLGKVTKHLPVSCSEDNGDEVNNHTATWTLNSNGYPTKVIISDGNYSDEITFSW